MLFFLQIIHLVGLVNTVAKARLVESSSSIEETIHLAVSTLQKIRNYVAIVNGQSIVI